MDANRREMEMRRRRRIAAKRRARKLRILKKRLILAGIVLVLLLTGILLIRGAIKDKKEEALQEQLMRAREKRVQLIEDNTIRVRAVGDNIIHDNILEKGKTDWNYDFLFEQTADLIQEADLSIVNQETIFIDDHEKTAGYPMFGSPVEVGHALVNAGFDVVQHASNHAYDMGDEGIFDTIDFWKKNYPDIAMLGIQDSQAEQEKIDIVQVKGMKLALLNYTQYINFDSLPEDKAYMVDMLNEEKAAADVAKAKEEADFVIFLIHAGTEDAVYPDATMQDWVADLAEWGVDLVIGTHPHVLQKYEMVERPDGGQMLVYYSLGNFASTQKTVNGLLGGMADIKLCRDWNTGAVTVAAYDLIPTIMHYNHDSAQYCVYPLSEYTTELAAEHGIHQEIAESFTIEGLDKLVKDRLYSED